MKFISGVLFSVACLMSFAMWVLQPTGDLLVRQCYCATLLMLVAIWLRVDDERKAG